MNTSNASEPGFKRFARNAIIGFGILLLGLIPAFVKITQLQSRLASANSELELARTRELAALAHLELSQNNFGVASRHIAQLYERLAVHARDDEEPARSVAVDALAKRDAMMTMLATADPAARNEIHTLAVQLFSFDDPEVSRARSK